MRAGRSPLPSARVVKLWKHHAAHPDADEVNAVAMGRGEPWLSRYGGKTSSEWFFPKALQILREDPQAYARAERLIEAADWIVWQLTGVETRNTTTAGQRRSGRKPTASRRGTTSRRSTRASRTSWTRRCYAASTPSAGAQVVSASVRQGGRDCCKEHPLRSRTSTRTHPLRSSAASQASSSRSWERATAMFSSASASSRSKGCAV